ncbi:hypothetical protein [Aeromonas phage ZPAH34]|uniref:hypothetical protein n=1 Tax=Aeromonas phage ZPAH34 TaxID=2924888 RepID=UPI0023294D71|nr:hypothetical protein PQD16_gp159 [Aeromonas phage ZPAH34]UOX39524.1 hypothetical protein [Aeromonas phage ZPAH34]
MITDSIIRTKRIKDPLFSSVKLYLADLAQQMLEKYGLAKYEEITNKYYNLKNEDVQIEPPTLFPNGKLIACFLSRKSGLFYADAILPTVELKDIFRDLLIAIPEKTKVQLENEITSNVVDFGCFYLTDQSNYVIVLNNNQNTIESVYEALGSIYWEEMTLTLEEEQNPYTKLSGSLKVKSPNMSEMTLGVYFKDHF